MPGPTNGGLHKFYNLQRTAGTGIKEWDVLSSRGLLRIFTDG